MRAAKRGRMNKLRLNKFTRSIRLMRREMIEREKCGGEKKLWTRKFFAANATTIKRRVSYLSPKYLIFNNRDFNVASISGNISGKILLTVVVDTLNKL